MHVHPSPLLGPRNAKTNQINSTIQFHGTKFNLVDRRLSDWPVRWMDGSMDGWLTGCRRTRIWEAELDSSIDLNLHDEEPSLIAATNNVTAAVNSHYSCSSGASQGEEGEEIIGSAQYFGSIIICPPLRGIRFLGRSSASSSLARRTDGWMVVGQRGSSSWSECEPSINQRRWRLSKRQEK